jgi:probable DNA metabolism protein
VIRVSLAPTFEAWRAEARRLLATRVAPDDVLWEDATGGQATLFGERAPAPGLAPETARARVPAAFVDLAKLVAFHRDPERWSLLYRALHRLTEDDPHLLEVTVDPLTARLRAMRQAVKREEHAMHAFVRFRRVEREGVEHFVAWHRPEHPVVRLAAPFFARRFPSMRWTILTPDESAFFDGAAPTPLTYGPGAPREAAPEGDELEEMFRTYYRSISNPARTNLRAMRAEMPARHWATMPELTVMGELVRAAPARVSSMQAPRASAAEAFVPASRALTVLRGAARGCEACALCTRATQTVFGEGAPDAPLMLVGEQPGDLEDRAGRPFVGPAGELLDRSLARVGLPRDRLYVTNAVKHFKWEPRGERRLHARPTHDESVACFAWLEAEIEAVRPRMILCLGSTAARAFLGKKFSVTRSRGQVFQTRWAPWWMATLHPAALLRAPDATSREAAQGRFDDDLATTAAALRRLTA